MNTLGGVGFLAWGKGSSKDADVRCPRLRRMTLIEHRAPVSTLEFADEPDLWLEVLIELLAHFRPSRIDQLTHVGGGGVAEVDHDVGVHVGDLRIAHAKSLQSTLVDEASGADAFDLLEDGSGARMPVE